MLNRVILVGRLTKDPELRYTPSGVAVTQFTLAVDRPFDNNGQREADFIPIVTWRQLAETCANYLKKGRLTAVEGRLQIRNYENNEGKRVYVSEIIADNVRFLESGQARQEGGAASGGQSSQQGSHRPAGNGYGGQQRDPFQDDGQPIDISQDDLPF